WQPGTISGGTGLITSVFGRTGAVTAQTGDYSFAQISGTVDLTQLPAGISAAKIQGANVSSSVPSEGQVLMYSSLNNRWQPGNVSGGGGAISSVFGRTGAIVAQSGDYSFSQITGTAALSQLPSGTDAGKLQGRDLATAAPSDGQALLWNASVNQWAPGTVSN